jgi:hypothetical protein
VCNHTFQTFAFGTQLRSLVLLQVPYKILMSLERLTHSTFRERPRHRSLVIVDCTTASLLLGLTDVLFENLIRLRNHIFQTIGMAISILATLHDLDDKMTKLKGNRPKVSCSTTQWYGITVMGSTAAPSNSLALGSQCIQHARALFAHIQSI